MDKVRIHEIAKEMALKSKDVVDKAKEMGLDVKSAASAVTMEQAESLLNYITNINTTPTPKKESVKAVTKNIETKESRKTPTTSNTKRRIPKKEIESKEKSEEIEKMPKKDSEESKEVKEAKIEEQVELVEPVDSKKIEKPIEDDIKEEKKPEEKPKKETLAQATMFKKSGLTIVKKKKPKEEKVEPKEEVKEEKRFSESPKDLLNKLSAQDENPSLKKKKKKEKKQSPAHSRKEKEEKIDILGHRDLVDKPAQKDDEEEVVYLADYHTIPDEKDKEDKSKKIDKDKIKIANTKQNRFIDNTPRRFKKRRKRPQGYTQISEDESSGETKIIEIPEDIRSYEFADKVGKPISEIIKILFSLGKMITKNDFLDKDDIEILCHEFNVDVRVSNPLEHLDYESDYDAIADESSEERPPVVTIMGHVDHGKTSLLDRIRDSRVANGEAGGITQHVGAYSVKKGEKQITFIDTPGHEAFTEMRARGAKVTDIAIIVVAADDGVRPQTVEALSHAKAAGVPIIIAINKIDKPDANIDMVKSQMAERDFTPTDWGGEYDFVEVSAKSGVGIDGLLETILLQSELMELKANPNRAAKAVVVESSLEKGKGPVATVIVQNGTLNVGDSIVVDTFSGKVRALLDDFGKNVKSAGLSDVAIVTGLDGVPPAGSVLVSVENDTVARDYAQKRADYVRQKELSKSTKVSIDELSALVAEGQLKTLPLIIKADVQGSLEAIKGSLEKLKNEEVKVNIIQASVGGITESDLSLASASENSVILGFNVRPTGMVKEKAKNQGIQIKTYSIIYDLLDDVRAILGGMMSPVIEEENTGQAEVRDTFTISKVGTIAGCIVSDGSIHRGIKVRLIRDGIIIYTGNIASLKRFKDDAREVSKGYECGIMLEGYNDIKVGDVFETFKEVERQRESI